MAWGFPELSFFYEALFVSKYTRSNACLPSRMLSYGYESFFEHDGKLSDLGIVAIAPNLPPKFYQKLAFPDSSPPHSYLISKEEPIFLLGSIQVYGERMR